MDRGGDVIFEFIQQGAYMKVSAVDARTGFEVSIVGDPQWSQRALEAIALRKLRYMQQKERQKRKQKARSSSGQAFPKIRRGGQTSGWDL